MLLIRSWVRKKVSGEKDFMVISKDFHCRSTVYNGLAHDLRTEWLHRRQSRVGWGTFGTETIGPFHASKRSLRFNLLDRKPKYFVSAITLN